MRHLTLFILVITLLQLLAEGASVLVAAGPARRLERELNEIE